MGRFIVLVLGCSFSLGIFAQDKGFVRGNVADGDFGGPMISAAVTVKEMPGVGAITDFDGNYSLPLSPGVYTIEVSFISYNTQSFPNVEVKAGGVTIIDAVMTSAAQELVAVEISASVQRNNEVAMLMEMKNATSVTDGLSAQAFRKVGDSDLSGAMRRVTGVTVQNGKYVYVRGLGDRYTKTTLNGMALPGLDPDVNAVQIDIFPTNILENVAVAKTFAPDMDGDFTGGLVNVVTKNFPEVKTTQIGAGMTFIPGMHLNPEYILYDRSLTAFTGSDFGEHKLHVNTVKYKKLPSIFGDSEDKAMQEEITRGFDPQLAPKQKVALPNGSFQFSHGNQVNTEGGTTFGYNAVFNYTNQTTFYKDFQANDYMRPISKSQNELFKQVSRKGNVGKNNVLWSGLLSGAWKIKKHSLSLTGLISRSSESSATLRKNQDFEQNQATLIESILSYNERTLMSGILNGNHRLGLVELTWANAVSRSRVYDPDFRETRISVTDNDTNLATGTGAGIDRFWRDLNEFNESFRTDLKVPVSEQAYIKIGGSATYKTRSFETYSYNHTRRNISDIEFNPDWFLLDENIWSADPNNPANATGTYTVGTFQAPNSYDARQLVFAGYAMGNHSLLRKLKLVYGARVETTQMFYTGVNNNETVRYNDTRVLNTVNILPSINATFKLTEEMNLRVGANRTLARPSFKEKSIAQIYDPITKRTFIGNIDLQQTSIDNFDFRYEYFIGPKELLSAGVFYKVFDGHIELVSYEVAPDNLKPRNSGLAGVYGVEFEFRKGLPKAESDFLNRLFLSTNLSLVQSAVDMRSVFVSDATAGDASGKSEFELRQHYAREGETISPYRRMTGQSPYAVNVTLSYEIPDKQTSVSFAYNVQGEQLTIIGSGRVPDIYTIPFHSLNFNAYKSFGTDLQHRVSVGVDNILNEDMTLVYRSYGAKDGIYTSFKPGRGFSLRYTYTF